jgi:uncharacterized protein (TIGR02466 family)
MSQNSSIQSALDQFRKSHHDDAARLCRAILASEGFNPTAHHILGKIAYLQERFAESVQHLQLVCDENCAIPEVLVEYGRTLRLAGKSEVALAPLRRALSFGANYYTCLELGLALAETGNLDEAKPLLEQALRIKPACPHAIRRLGHIACQQGTYPEAIRYYQKLIELFPGTIHSYPDLIKTHLVTGNPKAAMDLCRKCLEIDPACPGILAYEYVALSELGEIEYARYLCDPKRWVKRFTIEPPAGFDSVAEFSARLSSHILNNTIRTQIPERYATTHGWQTQALTLFQNDPHLGSVMNGVIMQAVASYMDQLVPDLDHPVFTARPTATHIDIWAVVLNERGHQAPHIHMKSWISGCYYVELPGDFDSQSDPNAGCIAFGRAEAGMHPLREPEVAVLRPRVGDIVLFPGYFWHHTFPLQSKSSRISIAFDIVPTLGWGK